MPSFGSPYRVVLHAVAVDASYDSSSAVVESLVRQCLDMAATEYARVVALPALATGYGQLSIEDFARGIQPLATSVFPPIDEVKIAVRSSDAAKTIESFLNVTK